MEMTHTLATSAWRPSFVLHYQSLRETLAGSGACTEPPSWDDSALNPKNLAESLDASTSGWRIDGATGCGTCFFAVPLCHPHPLVPLRVFIYLPDQGRCPPVLRGCLDAALSVPLRDGPMISRLGIAKHLCRAMDHQCAQDPGFMERYRRLPFGSQLVFQNVAANVADMALTVVPNYHLESQAISLAHLQQMWAQDLAIDAWPPAVHVQELHLLHQLHDTVSTVQICANTHLLDRETVIFKSVVDSYDHLYHELRFLLTAPRHPHIMRCPLAIVVKRTAFGGKLAVVGFILPYFPAGSIRDILPTRQRAGTLDHGTKLRWCQQVTSALIHLHEEAETFFADLRPDNVLLDSSVPEEERLILCDFEQRGNWHEWSAPEVRYRQYVENIRSTALRDGCKLSSDLQCLLESYRQNVHPSSPAYGPSESAVQAANRAWFALSRTSQEKAAVYSLGLFIYTVFEGISNVRKNLVNKWVNDPDVQFPQFVHTPPSIQAIVTRCTDSSGTLDHTFLPPVKPVERVGSSMYPQGQHDIGLNTYQSMNAVLDTAFNWWSTELKGAEIFTGTDEWNLHEFGARRPTLKQIGEALNTTDLKV